MFLKELGERSPFLVPAPHLVKYHRRLPGGPKSPFFELSLFFAIFMGVTTPGKTGNQTPPWSLDTRHCALAYLSMTTFDVAS